MAIFILLVYILSCYGMSNVMVFSRGPFGIFEEWRNLSEKINSSFGELFSCMMCFPFWVGALLSIINLFLLPSVLFTPFNIIIMIHSDILSKLFIIVMDGILSSGTTWILHNIEEYFEK
jgi:hypothetical protein